MGRLHSNSEGRDWVVNISTSPPIVIVFDNMKTALVLVGAVTLVLMSMEGPASASPAPSETAEEATQDMGAIKVLEDIRALNDALEAHEQAVRQKRDLLGKIGGMIHGLVGRIGGFF